MNEVRVKAVWIALAGTTDRSRERIEANETQRAELGQAGRRVGKCALLLAQFLLLLEKHPHRKHPRPIIGEWHIRQLLCCSGLTGATLPR